MITTGRSKSSGMRYERLFPLGSGGMATVELALAIGPGGFNRLVVLKSMHRELAANEDSYAMFLEEARLSARLNHPNVVQISEVLETSDGIVLVMEYLDGLPLSSIYRTASAVLTQPMRVRLICEVLAGLHYAHELSDFEGRPLGIVHRDVSPQNVFVTYDGRIKLLDFGIAKASDSAEHTRVGMIKGRIAYMPAEQLTGSSVDRTADIYAAGCLLWEALAGSRMWADQSEREIARCVLSGKIPSLGSRVQVDPALEHVVSRAIARDPSARYATAEEMRLELESFLSAKFRAVSAREIGEMLSSSSSEARENRRGAIANAIAVIDANGDEVSQRSVIHATGRPPRSSRSRLKFAEPPDSTRSGPSSAASNSSSRISARELLGRSETGSKSVPQTSPRKAVLLACCGIALLAAAVWGAQLGRGDREVPKTVANVSATTAAIISAPAPRAEVVAPGASNSEESPPETAQVANPAAKSRRHHAPTKTRATPAPAQPIATGNRCDPPYYFSNGNKTYKPECI